MLPVETQIVASIRRIVRAVDLHSKRLVEACGLTGPQLAVLHAVDRLGPCAPSTVAREVHLSQATVTGIVQRLERRGLLERARSATDRRSVLVSVSPAGAELLAAAPSLLQDRFRMRLRSLEEWERHQILATLQRVAGLMAAEQIDASPYLTSDTIAPAQAEVDAAEGRDVVDA